MTDPSESSASFRWDPPRDTTCDGVEPQMLCAFHQDTPPVLTIAVPTFRRPALLLETVRTVLAQTEREGLELVVIDNDPESDGHKALLAAEPGLADMAFRYFRNPTNVGMFGNWNMGIILARAPFLTILNDDDLLHPDFVRRTLPVIRDDASVEAAACSKRELDFRSGTARLLQASIPTRIVHAAIRFGLGNRRVIRPRHLFFTNVVGNSLGVIVRTATARAIGGFRSAEFPSADYFFMARLAHRGRFVQLKAVLAFIRIAENESAKPDVVLGFLRQRLQLQHTLLGGHAPTWWRRLLGISARFDLDHHRQLWRIDIDPDAASHDLGLPLPTRGRRVMRIAQLAYRAI